MEFPVVWNIAGREVHAHNVFESLGYLAGGQAYWWARRRERRRLAGDGLLGQPSGEQTLYLLTAAAVGAYVGSKVLAILESWEHYRPHLTDPQILISGKTIVGGLLGAWAAVEAAKWMLGIHARTGDAFVPALTVAIPIGRIGCFLEGLPDLTYGVATSLPWGVDFGDGVPRHPTQLYEAGFVLMLGAVVMALRPKRPGHAFRSFVLGYLLFRMCVECIKPRPETWGSLSAIQWASVVGVAACVWQLWDGEAAARDNGTRDSPVEGST